MRVDVSPKQVTAAPGRPALVTIHVTNTRDIISGHRLRVLGIDPAWATFDVQTLSLFPDTSGVATVTVTLPVGVPAGIRHLSVEVTELTPPAAVEVVEVEVTVPAQPGIKVALDPPSLQGGRSATAAVLLENTGNAVQEVALSGADDDGEVAFAFDPQTPVLGPGEQVLATVHLRARRPWFGSHKIRSFSVSAGPPRAPVKTAGAWVQGPRLTRGALALLGMAATVTVFAVVITASLSSVANGSAADRNLAIAVAEASQGSTASGNATISGTVRIINSSLPEGGVTVELFQASNPGTPIVSTATGIGGGYTFQGLAAGSYKLLFNGAGFNQVWWPSSLTADDATAVTVRSGQTLVGVNVRLGGVPGSITGQVEGTDPSGAMLTLELPGTKRDPTPTVVTTQVLAASGQFSLGDVQSPADYELTVSLQGYATEDQMIDLSSGQSLTGVIITLVQGDGAIGGTVYRTTAGTHSEGVSLARISATSGTSTQTTESLANGSFVLSDLSTPATFTLLVSAPGFASQTLTVSLAADQSLKGVDVTLAPGEGSISGTVSLCTHTSTPPTPRLAKKPPPPYVVTCLGGTPTGGVTVTASNGQQSVTTVSVSTATSAGAIGTYSIQGLPLPGDYSLTFTRPDLESQTLLVNLGGTGGSSAVSGESVTMLTSTATLSGVTMGSIGGPHGPYKPLGSVDVTLRSGTTTYEVTSATQPGTDVGSYAISAIAPGTYTASYSRAGVQSSIIIVLSSGEQQTYSPDLGPPATISGVVDLAQEAASSCAASATVTPLEGVVVTIYEASEYPSVPAASPVTTDKHGAFSITDLDAPVDYILTFVYPQGTAPQTTVTVDLKDAGESFALAQHVCVAS